MGANLSPLRVQPQDSEGSEGCLSDAINTPTAQTDAARALDDLPKLFPRSLDVAPPMMYHRGRCEDSCGKNRHHLDARYTSSTPCCFLPPVHERCSENKCSEGRGLDLVTNILLHVYKRRDRLKLYSY